MANKQDAEKSEDVKEKIKTNDFDYLLDKDLQYPEYSNWAMQMAQKYPSITEGAIG